jgi:hypothetical protein
MHIKRGLAIIWPSILQTAHNFFSVNKTQQSTSTLLMMPRAKGKANYKTDALIQVVEELLPNGAQGWTEVARLYQVCTGELAVREYDDVKQHWIEKCCNKFKKPTGNPGDPKSDMIPRCQRIQERIHEKSSSLIMGVDSGGDTGLDVSTDASDDDKESEEENELELEVVVCR